MLAISRRFLTLLMGLVSLSLLIGAVLTPISFGVPTAQAVDAPQTDAFSRFETIESERQGAEGGSQRVKLDELFTAIYQALSRIVLVAAFLSGMYGAYLYMFQGSDPKKVAAAREYITYAIISVIIVAILFALANVLTPGLITTS